MFVDSGLGQMDPAIFVDGGKQSRHGTRSFEGCVVLVENKASLGYEGHPTTGVKDGRTEAREM